MNTDNLILRQTENSPLINKEDTLTSAEFDANIIKIYNDLLANNYVSDETLTFSSIRSYVTGEYATYNGRLWVATTESTGVAPTIDSLEWNDIFPSILAHEKNKDTILDEGGTNETTVAEIRAFIDAGLTSTTNLSLSTKTPYSFKIESSTGADVTIPQATVVDAGLLNAEDKVKLDNTSGINTGDQTLESLSAEDITNKVTDFTTINDTLYPTTQAVDTYLTAQVPPLVETFIGGLVAQDLQSVTTVGNTTNDNIQFNEGAGVLFDNTSTLRKGTIDAGYGGAKGIAQVCSVGYELKWEAGRLYVMGDGGTTIREVSHNFTTTPSATDDNTKGFIVGSRWILDNGDLYVCSDVTTATAVWVLQTITTSDIADSLNKRYVTDANLTVIGNTSGTNTGDQIISDATLTTTDITTNNFSTTKHGFVPKGTNVGNFLKDDGTWGTPASGSSSGIWGIANASGVYTYYATWSLAVASATSGQVIELFADITETTVSYILKNGVNVNGNGHTITFSNSLNGFDDNNVSCTVVFSDINLVKTQNLAYAVIQCFNASSNVGGYNTTINVANASGYGFFGCGVIWGLRIIGTGCAILTKNSASLNIDKCYILSYVDGYPASTTTYNDCYIKSTTNAVRESPTMNNCIVISTGGVSYIGNSRNITNCTLISMTSNVISGSGYFENCYIYSAANTCINTSSLTEFHNCYIESATQYLNVFGTSAGSFYNCTLKTNLNPVFYGASPKIYNSNLINIWNSASGRITEDCTNVVMVNNYILVANSSAFVNYSGASKTIYMYGNAIKGTSNINSPLITNGQTNTADAQGNVILN